MYDKNTVGPSYPMSSLFVSDLHPDVSEAMLLEKFSTAGPIVSIKVCRDKKTGLSFGNAYVNFQQPADAERVLKTMNFVTIKGRPCRIMWTRHDPLIRNSGLGNIFIKNLDKSIDNKALFDAFSAFGNILSCKIATDENGSKGYGFVQFDTEEAARNSIEQVNGMLLNKKKVFVGQFMTRRERIDAIGDRAKLFTNVYVKNFGDALDEDKLRDIFSACGPIVICKIMTDDSGKRRGFGFVSYEEHEAAQKAVDELNNTEIDGQTIFVGRAQKKAERQAELKERFDRIKQERRNRFQLLNLYVNNLDVTVDEEQLKKEFSAFGTITSAMVMCENGRSKGYGFVCFSLPEEATKAMVEMNGRVLASKPLHVTMAQSKDEHKAPPNTQGIERISALQMTAPVGQAYPQNPNYIISAAQRFYPPAIQQVGPLCPPWLQAQMRTGVQQSGETIPGALEVQMMRGSIPMVQQQQVRPAQMASPIAGPTTPVTLQYATMPATTCIMPPMSTMTQIRGPATLYNLCAPDQPASGQTVEVNQRVNQAPVGQMYHQSPNYIMSAAQRFYPPAIQQVGPPYPLRLQSQIRTAVQQSGAIRQEMSYQSSFKAPMGQIHTQNPDYIGGAQRFYPPAIQQVGPLCPPWLQAQMRTGVQQSGETIPGALEVQMMRGSIPMVQQQQVRPAQMASPITGPTTPVTLQYATMPATIMPTMSTTAQGPAIPYNLCTPDQSASGQVMLEKLSSGFKDPLKMAISGKKIQKQLREITECPICMSTFTDPRMLPCIHTFCFECLKCTSEATQKNPGDMVPCPLCRKEFIVPEDGMNGMQKNFFMENLLEFKTTLHMGSDTIICDLCNMKNEGKTGDIPEATAKCVECQEYYCGDCAKAHRVQKLSRSHQIVNTGNDV